MDVLVNLGIYLAIGLGLVGIIFGATYLKKKFNIKDSEIELGEKVINLLVYITSKSNFKYSGDLKLIAKYVLDAIDFVNEIEDAVSIEEKKALVENEALEICIYNGLKIDNELVQIVSEIVDFFVK